MQPSPDTRPRRTIASRARLYTVAGSLLSLVIAFTFFAIGWSVFETAQHTADLGRQVVALAKGQAAAEQTDAALQADARDRLLRVESGLMGAALLVTDNSGVVLRSTVATPTEPLPLTRLRTTRVAGASSARLRTGTGVPVLMVAASIDATRQLVAIESLAELRRTQAGILAIALAALLAAAGVSYVTAGLLARRLTGPLVRLEAAADHVAAGDLGTQVAEEGDAETASLAHSFNRMSSRVADAYAAQKAFIGDVSHEIRTPLTSIRGFAEALLDGVIADSEGQRRALNAIHAEAGRISEMSETLLALAELDAGAVHICRAPIDVAILKDALTGRFTSLAEESGIRLEIGLAGSGAPLGDAERLLQVASALLANALAHTPPGGVVRVSAETDAARWTMAVDDSGPGVPASERARIFERFARLDASRATVSGGVGLGLSIAHRLVELMGGTIGVEDSDLGGARFWVSLDVAPSESPFAG